MKRTILVVEDNYNDELLTLRAFKKNNIHEDIVVVRDGQEALEYLFFEGKYSNRDNSANPVFILLDLNLPKLTGHEVLKKLKENEKTASIPVIIMTTSDEQVDLVNSYKLGANSFVLKPIKLEDFTIAIKQIVNYWLSLNQQPT